MFQQGGSSCCVKESILRWRDNRNHIFHSVYSGPKSLYIVTALAREVDVPAIAMQSSSKMSESDPNLIRFMSHLKILERKCFRFNKYKSTNIQSLSRIVNAIMWYW